MTTIRKTGGRSTPSSSNAPATWRRTACWSSSFPANGWRSPARYLASHYRNIRCWAFPSPEREVFDQVVLMGCRRAEPHLDTHAEEQVLEWAAGELEETLASALPRRGRPRRAGGRQFSSPTAPSTPWRPLPRRGGRGCGPAPG